MNQELGDKRIRELFHELGQEDERQTPGFAGVLKAALDRKRPPQRLLVWRVAAALALPVTALVFGLALLGNQSIESLPPVDLTSLMGLPTREASSNSVPSRPPPPVTLGPRNQKSASRPQRQSIHISQWQSPTDFLLKTPGSDFLRNLPRMPDSPPGIPRTLPDNHN